MSGKAVWIIAGVAVIFALYEYQQAQAAQNSFGNVIFNDIGGLFGGGGSTTSGLAALI